MSPADHKKTFIWVIVIISGSKGYKKDTVTSSVNKKVFLINLKDEFQKIPFKIPSTTLLQQKLKIILP